MPTDKGYRLFVDRLSDVKPLTRGRAPGDPDASSDGAVDLDDVVSRTVRLLAQLTRQVAVVQYPSLTRSSVRHVELVSLAVEPGDDGADHRHRPGRAAGGGGRLDRRTSALGELRARLNAQIVGRRLAEVPALLADLAERLPGAAEAQAADRRRPRSTRCARCCSR